jgi:hypothetical protein
MTTDLALEYIPRRMCELGYGDEYSLRFVHLVMQPAEIRKLEATCEFFILVEEPLDVNIDSDMGIFDLSYTAVNELQYEHQGFITVTNKGTTVVYVRFIQVIPKNTKK